MIEQIRKKIEEMLKEREGDWYLQGQIDGKELLKYTETLLDKIATEWIERTKIK